MKVIIVCLIKIVFDNWKTIKSRTQFEKKEKKEKKGKKITFRFLVAQYRTFSEKYS